MVDQFGLGIKIGQRGHLGRNLPDRVGGVEMTRRAMIIYGVSADFNDHTDHFAHNDSDNDKGCDDHMEYQ